MSSEYGSHAQMPSPQRMLLELLAVYNSVQVHGNFSIQSFLGMLASFVFTCCDKYTAGCTKTSKFQESKFLCWLGLTVLLQ